MMKVLCNKATKKIEGFSRWDDISHEASSHIVVEIDYVPDMEGERLNDTGDGLRLATQVELDGEIDADKDKKASIVDPVLKAYILSVNDGSIVPGMTQAQLKSAIKAKL